MMSIIERVDNSLAKGLQQFFKRLLETRGIDALFLPVRLKDSTAIMPSLVTDPAQIENANPFNPAFPVNAARMVSRLSYKESGRKTAVLLRPCEMRAFIELIKLKQGSRQELILIGMDCPKALTPSDYAAYMNTHSSENGPLADEAYIQKVFTEKSETLNGFHFTHACRTCENPFPMNTDMSILVHGVDLSKGMVMESGSDIGRQILESMNMTDTDMPPTPGEMARDEIEVRDEIKAQIKEANFETNQSMVKEIEEKTDSIVKLNSFFDQCINCYNCRNMCPVCYCKECVFNTDVFFHQPVQYHQWAEKKGSIKLPTDTLFYHLTRMAHMGHACVGCGQCSNACPSNIDVFQLFKSVAQQIQTAFEYSPGINEDEPPPLSVFYEKEFENIVGIDGNN